MKKKKCIYCGLPIGIFYKYLRCKTVAEYLAEIWKNAPSWKFDKKKPKL